MTRYEKVMENVEELKKDIGGRKRKLSDKRKDRLSKNLLSIFTSIKKENDSKNKKVGLIYCRVMYKDKTIEKKVVTGEQYDKILSSRKVKGIIRLA